MPPMTALLPAQVAAFDPRALRNGAAIALLLDDRSPRTMAAGMAAQFTAANSEYLSVADNAALSTGDIAFTVAAWVRLDTLSNQTILSKWNNLSGTSEYLLFYDHNEANGSPDARFCFAVSVSGTSASKFHAATSFGAPSTGTWYFVVAWHDPDADTLNIQVNNGTVDSVSYSSGMADRGEAFRIGALGAGAGLTYYLNGRAAGVGCWKRVLTSAERTQLYGGGNGWVYDPGDSLTTNMVAYWPLSEPSGQRNDVHGTNHLTDNNTVTTAAGVIKDAVEQWDDRSGFGRHATQSTQASKPGLRWSNGRAVRRFDGTDDFLSVANFTLPTLCSVVVVGAFGNTSKAMFLEHGPHAGTTNGMFFWGSVGDATSLFRTAKNSGSLGAGWMGTAAAVVTFIYNGSVNAGTVYKNGVALTYSSTTGTVRPNSDVTDTLYIGSRAGTSVFTSGDWLTVAITAVALTDREHRQLERWTSRSSLIPLTGAS